jgi:hypothetical protein
MLRAMGINPSSLFDEAMCPRTDERATLSHGTASAKAASYTPFDDRAAGDESVRDTRLTISLSSCEAAKALVAASETTSVAALACYHSGVGDIVAVSLAHTRLRRSETRKRTPTAPRCPQRRCRRSQPARSAPPRPDLPGGKDARHSQLWRGPSICLMAVSTWRQVRASSALPLSSQDRAF